MDERKFENLNSKGKDLRLRLNQKLEFDRIHVCKAELCHTGSGVDLVRVRMKKIS